MSDDEINGSEAVARAVVPLRASSALESSDAWRAEVGRWNAMIRTGVLPKHVRTAEMAITIARIGEAYGWDPMRSLRSIYLVEGRPELSAETYMALIREKCPEASVYPVEVSSKRVTIRVLRPPQIPEPVDVTVTAEQFKHLIRPTRNGNASVWQTYTEDMLWARCVSRVGRRLFSDVTAGAYTTGELTENSGMTVRQGGKPAPEKVDPPSLTPEEIEPEVVEGDDYEPAVVPGLCELCGGVSGDHVAGCPEDEVQG